MRARLRAAGVAVEAKEYAMGHEGCAAELRDVGAWLAARLPAAPAARL